jgi:hypothetical protein
VVRLRVLLCKGIRRDPVVVEQLVDLHCDSLRLSKRAADCGLADQRSGCKNAAKGQGTGDSFV